MTPCPYCKWIENPCIKCEDQDVVFYNEGKEFMRMKTPVSPSTVDDKINLIKEYTKAFNKETVIKEPREFWICLACKFSAYKSPTQEPEHYKSYCNNDLILVREVITDKKPTSSEKPYSPDEDPLTKLYKPYVVEDSTRQVGTVWLCFEPGCKLIIKDSDFKPGGAKRLYVDEGHNKFNGNTFKKCSGTAQAYVPATVLEALQEKNDKMRKALEEIINIDELYKKGAFVVSRSPEEIAKEALE